MNKNQNDILQRVDRKDGFTVPEGFFEDFADRFVAAMPVNEAAEQPRIAQAPRTFWERIRPYAYMAAMFAGIWCMLKVFTMMSPAYNTLSIENNHVLTEALSDDNFIYDHIVSDISERELFEQIYDDVDAIDGDVDFAFDEAAAEMSADSDAFPIN